MGPAFHDREYPRHVGGDDYLPALRTDARHSATGYSLKGHSRFRPIVKSEQGPSPALHNIAAMKDSGQIRRMTDYGTPVSGNPTPSRDMVERPSPLCD